MLPLLGVIRAGLHHGRRFLLQSRSIPGSSHLALTDGEHGNEVGAVTSRHFEHGAMHDGRKRRIPGNVPLRAEIEAGNIHEGTHIIENMLAGTQVNDLTPSEVHAGLVRSSALVGDAAHEMEDLAEDAHEEEHDEPEGHGH